MIPTIYAPRLRLRPLEFEDATVLYRIYQNEGVLQYFPTTTPPPLEKVERFIAGQLEHWETHAYGNWGIVPHEEDQIIGWVGLQFLPELNETEIGHLLDKPYWGKGLATEAASKSVRYGLDELKLDHMIALVHRENIASQRVIQKCGTTYVETIPIWGIDLMRYRVNRS